MEPAVLVLVVEDEEAVRELLEQELENAGFTVVTTSGGEEAIAMLDAEGANYSAVITDINLSGEVLGWEVARHAREVKEKMPVIYMTGANSQEWASLGVPKSQLVPKPLVVAQVITAVSQLINEAASAL